METSFHRNRKIAEGSGIDAFFTNKSDLPVLICLLGSFRLLKRGQPLELQRGGKTEALLRILALQRDYSIPREKLLYALWPDSPVPMAGQSLNSLVYAVHRLLGEALNGAEPIVHAHGIYRLNVMAGLDVDVTLFDNLAKAGDRYAREGKHSQSTRCRALALSVYQGDLCEGTDLASVLERERLRSLYLTLLARLADFRYSEGNFGMALENALRLLTTDPCREDAHRLAMRCYVRLGERAQALRQYRLCERILRSEFDTDPEAATKALFDQIRLDPAKI